MKKILTFLACVALCCVALTSCDKEGASSLAGTVWSGRGEWTEYTMSNDKTPFLCVCDVTLKFETESKGVYTKTAIIKETGRQMFTGDTWITYTVDGNKVNITLAGADPTVGDTIDRVAEIKGDTMIFPEKNTTVTLKKQSN